jgi:hypothetical protein
MLAEVERGGAVLIAEAGGVLGAATLRYDASKRKRSRHAAADTYARAYAESRPDSRQRFGKKECDGLGFAMTNLGTRGAFDMRNLSIVLLIVASFALSGIGSAVAGNMGDPSAGMRQMQAICDAQRRGEYPRYHDACLPDYPDRSGISNKSVGRYR